MSTPTVFTGISKQPFAEDLIVKLKNPDLIKQANTGTCGAAVLSNILASMDPVNYATTALNLFKFGTATTTAPGGDMTLTAPDCIKKSSH